MNSIRTLLDRFSSGAEDARLLELYRSESQLEYQRNRYQQALQRFLTLFGDQPVELYSAPGRTEIGGNHTDHQQGRVLAASINLDAIAVVSPLEGQVRLVSEGMEEIQLDLEDLTYREEEKETTLSLVKGVLAQLKTGGATIGGFTAYVTSDVLVGAGLSSSAAFETLIGTIVSGLYNQMQISPVEIAMVGQQAENLYFGKPCGLMDQMASSVGNLVAIDFAQPGEPVIQQVSCDLDALGYSLCITDTKGSHADLTAEYAAVPQEMRAVAEQMGQPVLRGITLEQLLEQAPAIRTQLGDRALLRALHFVQENDRVAHQVEALEQQDFQRFLHLVEQSGASSFQYLQNVYTNQDVQHQNVSIALAVSQAVLGDDGVCRVHGGGFAGTIQAYVRHRAVPRYQQAMEHLFGAGSCHLLHIRPFGGVKVI